MRDISYITRHAEVSEKSTERYLRDEVRALGGVCLKYSNPAESGYPDRLAILPGGRMFFVELKSAGCKTTKLQSLRIDALRRLGVRAYVCDSRESINEILSKEAGNEI